MIEPKDLIGHISGGRVLDVATGSGGFIHFLLDGLKDYSEITGIDTNERAGPAFAEAFKDKPGVRFEKMDAAGMDFPDGSFDTVSISNSLHHFEDPRAVLDEMKRVLRPGGHLILAEMYRDGQAETQMTHVLLHHWWAAIDRAVGVIHNETYCRADILEMLAGWEDLTVHDLSETDEDPKSAEILDELDAIINRYIQRAEGHPDLQARGEDLRKRVHEIGFHGAASLLVVGSKPV
jgi:ubiquinone/menaquinone biosynthesis C-methylase UbiE